MHLINKYTIPIFTKTKIGLDRYGYIPYIFKRHTF